MQRKMGFTQKCNARRLALHCIKLRSICHKKQTDLWVGLFFILGRLMGLEEGGLAERQGKKYAGGMFFSPGESPFLSGRILLWMWTGRKLAVGGVK